jgi:hypothetical protein
MATQTQAQTQQEWLEQLVGDWEFEGSCPSNEGKEPEIFRGKETFRRLGEHWVIGEAHGDAPGGGVSSSIFTLGYDTQKETFVGSFICTMMNSLWVYTAGTLSEDGKSLTLDNEGPNFMANDGSTAKYRDVFSFISPDHRTLTAFIQGADGEWVQIMESHYHRK